LKTAISLTILRITFQHLNFHLILFLLETLILIAFGCLGFTKTTRDFMTNTSRLQASLLVLPKILQIIGKRVILQRDRISKCLKK